MTNSSTQQGSEHGGRCYKEQSVHPIWDCGSLLYDSFELNSLKRQLDAAIVSSHRTMSMPHLPSGHEKIHQNEMSYKSKKSISFRFAKSLRRFLSSIFKPNALFLNNQPQKDRKENLKDRFYKKASGLRTIPEVPELDGAARQSPDQFSCLVRRSASERFHYGRTPRD